MRIFCSALVTLNAVYSLLVQMSDCISNARADNAAALFCQRNTYCISNARADNALATKLALEVPRTSNLSEFPL